MKTFELSATQLSVIPSQAVWNFKLFATKSDKKICKFFINKQPNVPLKVTEFYFEQSAIEFDEKYFETFSIVSQICL